jgi:predicted nucleotidyltransferase
VTEQWIAERTILQVYRGSRAYGTYEEGKSDIDIGAVCIPPIERVLGLDTWEAHSRHEPVDEVTYSLRHFCQLAAQCNPNIIELLYSPPDCIITLNEAGKRLVQSREMFLSRRAAHTFGGYAAAQMKRMQNSGKGSHAGHADLVSAYGYDTKNAMHLVRLLESGVELLQTGVLTVRRPNADRLLEIKHGAYALSDLIALAEQRFAELHQAEAVSPLPETPDTVGIDRVIVDLTLDYR